LRSGAKLAKEAGMSNLIHKNEKGMVLPLGLMFLAIIAILGTTAVIVSTTDLKIGSNYRASEQAFYAAEAGLEEARARLRNNAANPINDGHPTHFQWRAYIGPDVKAKGKGYDSSNAMHIRLPSLQSDLDYVVEISHQIDASGNILYWAIFCTGVILMATESADAIRQFIAATKISILLRVTAIPAVQLR
jgi:hypothetical protein